MANTAKDLPTAERSDYQFSYPAAAGYVGFRGSMVGSVMVSTTRHARAWVTADLVVGVAQNYVDNAAGANGDKQVPVKLGCFRFAQNATITDAHIGQFAKPVDDQTVALDAAASSANTCGRIVAVDSVGVWVDFRKYSN